MPKFFLHLHERETVYSDDEGADFDDVSRARLEAIRGARDIMGHEVRAGVLCLSSRILIEDEAHRQVDEVHFYDVVALSGLPASR